jgi:ribosome-associated protein
MPNPFKKKSTRAKATTAAAKSKSPAAKPAKKTRAKTAKRAKPKKVPKSLLQVVSGALDDLQALEVLALDVQHLTTLTDTMIIASGRSDRHVRAVAGAVVEQCKKAGFRPIGVEGVRSGDWVLVDLGGVVVHVMLPRVREFYNLEKLWDLPARAEPAEAVERAE